MELHLSPRVIGKGSKGRTACGSAAYRSGGKIVDNDGVVHDFRYKRERVCGGIELPDGAPEELRDCQTLWSRHEERDRRKDAQIYRDIEFSLPNELALPDEFGVIDYSACKRIAIGMASELTAKGMCVQWDVHDKYKYKDVEDGTAVTNPRKMRPDREYEEIRNLHIHMMVTMRELNEDGTFGKKVREWNKFNGGLNIADLLRPKAAELMNIELQAIGSTDHVEHLSYAERGVDKIATTHVGTAATAMEDKGIKTDRGSDRRYIEWLNEIHAANVSNAKKQVKRLDDLIKQAENPTKTEDVYRDWDALFAYLRDLRRSKSAIAGELKRLEKIAAAYKNEDHSYLKWAGCDPNDEAHRLVINTTLDSLRGYETELRTVEDTILRCKDKIKVHNDMVYASKKVNWDAYQIERNKRGLDYCARRAKYLANHITQLRSGLSLLDTIFQTERFKECMKQIDELQAEQERMWAEYKEKREAIRESKQDLKDHKADLKQAKKDLKEIQKAEKRESRKIDRDER